MPEELKHSGDCSIWISPICDCGVLRRAISDGKTVLINGASATAQWAAHLVAIDAQRHAFARMDDPDKPKPAPVKINLHESTGRTIAEEIEEYERTKGKPCALRSLVAAVIDLRCPSCHTPVPVSFET